MILRQLLRSIPVLNCRRQPDAASRDCRRGPPQARNRSLPHHVPRFAPLERQTSLAGVSLPRWTAELRPVFSMGCQRGQCENQRKNNPAGHNRRGPPKKNRQRTVVGYFEFQQPGKPRNPSPSGRGLGEGLRICRNLDPHPTRFARRPLPEGEAFRSLPRLFVQSPPLEKGWIRRRRRRGGSYSVILE